MKTSMKRILLPLLLLFLYGCDTHGRHYEVYIPSEDNSQLFRAAEQGASTVNYFELRARFGSLIEKTDIDLEGEDSLYAVYEDEKAQFADESMMSFSTPTYSAKIDQQYEKGKPIKFELYHQGSVLYSTISLDEFPEIVDSEISDDGTLYLEWENVGAKPFGINLQGNCFSGYYQELTLSQTSFSIDLNSLGGSSDNISCPVNVVVEWKKEEPVNKVFPTTSNKIELHVKRWISL